MEELEERHQVEMKVISWYLNNLNQVYKQKVKHLHYEHQNNLTQLKTDGEVALKVQNDENKSKELAMKKMNKKTKQEMKELEISHEDVTKNLKMVS